MENKSIVTGIFATIALITTSLFAASASAGEITLFAHDGSTTIVGELISFDEDTYTVRTTLGVLFIYAEDVICKGAECPVVSNADLLANS